MPFVPIPPVKHSAEFLAAKAAERDAKAAARAAKSAAKHASGPASSPLDELVRKVWPGNHKECAATMAKLEDVGIRTRAELFRAIIDPPSAPPGIGGLTPAEACAINERLRAAGHRWFKKDHLQQFFAVGAPGKRLPARLMPRDVGALRAAKAMQRDAAKAACSAGDPQAVRRACADGCFCASLKQRSTGRCCWWRAASETG